MYECVNPMHPDKVADRIGGAILDLAYKKCDNPIVAGEMTLGHGVCFIVLETNVAFKKKEIKEIVNRITGHKPKLILKIVPQDAILARNQREEVRCGDNGIFVGNRVLKEERVLKNLANEIYKHYKTDGKYIIDGHKFIICQSYCEVNDDWISNLIKTKYDKDAEIIINPLGYWTGSEEVDTGSVNRKLGSDMGRNVTGGGLHFKDISKADVSVNIYAFLKAQKWKKRIELNCAIGDTKINGKPYSEIVRIAKEYIDSVGGFEKFAEWGLIRPTNIDDEIL